MQRVFAVLIAMVFLWQESPAFADDSWITNLTAQFRSEIPQQDGRNCHIYTSVAALEALCYRKIGQKLDFSEAQMLANHYLVSARNDEKLDLDVIYSRITPRGDTVYQNTSTLGAYDSGKSLADLKQLKSMPAVCLENEFGSALEFQNQVLKPFRESMVVLEGYRTSKHQWANEISKEWFANQKTTTLLTEMINDATTCYESRNAKKHPLEDQVSLCLERGYKVSSSDDWSAKNQKDKSKKTKTILELLKKGVPVICAAGAMLKKKQIDLLSEKSGHATLIIGHRMNSTTKAIEWLVRDPNYETPVVATGGCKTISWID